MLQVATSGTSSPPFGSEQRPRANASARDTWDMSDKERAMSGVQNAVRIAITVFVLVLLTVLTLGLLWTGSHQPPPLRTAR